MKAIRLFLTLSFSLITILSSTYVTGGNAPAPVAAHDDGTVYILAIGNSFTDDSVRDYFHGFTNADGKKVVVGFMYIPGCSLERHLTNAREDKPDYEFWKSDTEGNYSSTKSSRLSEVIPSERWDYIVFQQQSGLSGVYQSYEESLPELVEYTKGLAANPDVTYVFHMTWAYASDFGSERFGRYGYDQPRMYNAITAATYRGVRLVGINLIIPS